MSLKYVLAVFLLGLSCTPHLFAEEKVKSDEQKGLKVGDVAPDFEMKGSDGKDYKLSDYKDKSAVIVAWYPKALTPG